jgi:hypothetical protein
MSEGLLRQRRNLIITCTLLWLLKYGGVSFSKLSFAGFDIHFNRPEALYVCLWISFWYFLYRYYQYFSDEGVTKLAKVFLESTVIYCNPAIRALVKELHPHSNDAGLYEFTTLRQNGWVYRGQNLQPDENGRVSKSEDIALAISPKKLVKPIFKAYAETIFRNSVATDYLLPFVLAIIVIWYSAGADWNGGLYQLVYSAVIGGA